MFYAAGFVISFIYFASCSAENSTKCRDISIFCNITTLNICGRPDLSKYCHKTCNLCSDVTTTTTTTTTPSSQDCLDQWTNCTVLEPVVCLNDSDIATIYCSKTCNNCMATTTVEPSAATQFNSWLAIFYFILFFATTKLLA